MTSRVEADELLERCAATIRSIIRTRRESGDLELPEHAHVKVYGVVLPALPPPSRGDRRSQMNLVICGAAESWAYADPDRYRDRFSRVPSEDALTLGRQLAELAEPYKPTWQHHKVVASLQYGPDLT